MEDINCKKEGLTDSGLTHTITEERIREIIQEEIMKNLSCTLESSHGDIEVTLRYGRQDFTKGKYYFNEIIKVLKEFHFI